MKYLLTILVAACSVWLGMAFENHRQKQHAGEPLAAIAAVQCGALLGIVVVAHNGVTNFMTEVVPEDFNALQKLLGSDNTGILTAACNKRPIPLT